jgi:predicted dinucleotide-binding enzyme
VCNTDSLGEQIQRAFPQVRVVKALNTISAPVMVDPRRLGDVHAVFICGDDAAAKAEVTRLLLTFGWADDGIVDLGDISNARGTEMYLGLWVRLMRALGTPSFNVAIVRGV